jgi:cytochrome P450
MKPNRSSTPALFQMFNWIADPLSYLSNNAKLHGDIIEAQFINFPPFILIGNPQMVQEVFNADIKLFDIGKGNKIMQPLLGEYSVIMQEGEQHQKQRKLMVPAFHGDRMRGYGKLICDIAISVFSENLNAGVLPVRPLMQEITLRVILEAVFGISDQIEDSEKRTRYHELKRLLTLVLEGLSSPLKVSFLFFPFLQKDIGTWSPWGQFLERSRQIDKLIFAEIQSRRDEPEQVSQNRTDILSMLMATKDEAGESLSNVELRDDLMTLLVAGHETTASALSWAFYWVHHQSEVLDKLGKELAELGENPDPNAVFQLPYLTAVCNETLRIYPVGMLTFPRVVRSPMQIMGYDFEAGTFLAPCIYIIHNREDIYPEPHKFRPERFLERQFSPYEFFPFGGGSRRCLGNIFAQFEMKLVLATILTKFKLTLVNNSPIKPVRRGLTIAPSDHLSIKISLI